jgi:Carboxypeptidase regulatory-like domain
MKPKAVVLLVLLALACTHAPSAPRAIAGVVTDGNAPLPGVRVTLSSSRLPDHTTVTDADGFYTFTALAPGSYVVRAELDGFNAVSTRVSLKASHDALLETTLRLAAVSEHIVTAAEAPMFVERLQRR